MTQRIHNENADWLEQLFRDLPHHNRERALSGKLDDNGITTNPNTTEGLPARYMWVRTEAFRTGTRALIGPGMFVHYRRPNRRIWVGRNDVGEFVAIEPITDSLTAAMEGSDPYNDTDGGSGSPVPASLLVGLRLLPPRDAHASGLWVFLEADPTLGWLGGDVEVTSGAPASAGQFGWTVVYFDPDTGAPGIYTAAAEVKPNKEALTFDADALIAALPAGVYPAGAVSLYNGQTEVTGSNSRFEDLRRFVNATPATTFAGDISLDDGTVSAPSLYFTLDPNTGIYRVGTDQMGLAAGGVKVTEVSLVSGQRVLTFGDGTGAAQMRYTGAAGELREIRFYSGAALGANARWFMRVNATAEGGSNAGSDFQLIALDDSGGTISNAFSIKRSTGDIGVNMLPTVIGAKLDVNGSFRATSLIIASDTDASTILGRARLDSRTTDRMVLSHFDMTTQAQAALTQLATGQTLVNANTGTSLSLRINDAAVITITSTLVTLAQAMQMADFELARPLLKDYAETLQAHGNTSTTETIDLENGNVHSITLDANCTLTFSNPPATGRAGSFTLIVTQDATGGRTLTYPASVDWPSGVAPTLSTGANDVDILTFLTTDGGSRWFGFVAGQDFS